MLEPAVLTLRLVQYGAASVLFGTALFFVYAIPRNGAAQGLGWPPRVLMLAGVTLALASLLSLFVHTGVMAGSLRAAIDPSALAAVAEMGLGRAALARAAAAALAVVALAVLRAGHGGWATTAGLGAIAAASLAWMGHAAGGEGAAGAAHLAADIVHVLAACLWIGAILAFVLLVKGRTAATAETVQALQGFGKVGSVAVAVLVATGSVNSWFLVGPSGLESLLSTNYGLLLCAKLVLFGVMLLLAANNRFRLTPALDARLRSGEDPETALRALKQSLTLETLAGAAVLGAVAWLGVLVPIASR